MKVVDIERIVVDVPFTKRQQKITAREVYNWAILELCRVETDTGHVGWGETVIHYTWARVSDESVARVIGQTQRTSCTTIRWVRGCKWRSLTW